MTISFETLRWTGARLGPDNPLPPLKLLAASRAGLQGETFPADAWHNLQLGELNTLLPYSEQNGYDRHREQLELPSAILENELMRVTVLPSLGGRVWSIHHKRTGRELLHTNTVIQPANLALRNAWFSGGIEWNIGMVGHSPHTMSPLFCAVAEDSTGHEVLRMWEYERIRQLAYCIDIWLEGELLLCAVNIENANPSEVPLYWWSNVAVPETPATRVLAPADDAIKIDYQGRYQLQALPRENGVDLSYPSNSSYASDYYFDLHHGAMPWVAALDERGAGIFQASTALLLGRKLFMWGSSRGGKRWQSFLAEPGSSYIEIQGGLCRTQLEYLGMPAGARWSWLEAYGLLEAEASSVHGVDWRTATAAAQESLASVVDAERLEDRHQRWREQPPVMVGEVKQHGSGWGVLEEERRRRNNEQPLSNLVQFPLRAIGNAAPWLRLLESGVFGGDAPTLTQHEWLPLLELATATEPAAQAERLLHLGLMEYARGEFAAAEAAWRASLNRRPSVLAARNLAVLLLNRGDTAGAVTELQRAWRSGGPERNLALELADALFTAGDFAGCVAFLAELPRDLQVDGRLQVMTARALLRFGHLDQVGVLLGPELVVADIREGESLLELAWSEYAVVRYAFDRGLPPQEALLEPALSEMPLPPHLDFRMHRRPVSFTAPLRAGEPVGEGLIAEP